MNKVRFGFILLGTVLLQSTVFSRLQIFGAQLNLSLAFIMALATLYGPLWGAYAGLGLGLFEDILFGPVLGVRALIYFLVGTVMSRISFRQKLKPLLQVLTVTGVSIFAWALSLLLDFLLGQPLDPVSYLKGPLFIECLYNSIFYLLWLALLKKVLPPRPVKTFSSLL